MYKTKKTKKDLDKTFFVVVVVVVSSLSKFFDGY